MSKKRPLVKIFDKVLFDGTPLQLQGGENKRGFRAYFVRSYASKEALREIFEYCSSFCYIMHDKDTNEDGTPKQPHCHFIVHYPNTITPTAFAKRLSRCVGDEQTVFSPLGDKACAVRYMLHVDMSSIEVKKHRYNESELLTDNADYYALTDRNKAKRVDNDEILADIVDGSLTRRELASKYGRDYMKNYLSYDRFAREVKIQEQEQTQLEARTDLVKISLENGTLADIICTIFDEFAPRIMKYGVIPSHTQINNYIDTLIGEITK